MNFVTLFSNNIVLGTIEAEKSWKFKNSQPQLKLKVLVLAKIFMCTVKFVVFGLFNEMFEMKTVWLFFFLKMKNRFKWNE